MAHKDRTVLEFLAHDLNLLEVLLAVLPLLDVVDAVAVGTFQLLHGCTIDGVHKLHGEVLRARRVEHPLDQLVVAVVHGLYANIHSAATGDTGNLAFTIGSLIELVVYHHHFTRFEILNLQYYWCYILCHILFPFYSLIVQLYYYYF